jgi:hypothetical protein
MKTSRIIQFAVSAVLASTGCGILLSGGTTLFAAICFCLASLALHQRTKLSRPEAERELLIMIGAFPLLAAFFILTAHFIPGSSGERFFRQPLVIGTFWVIMIAALFWRWRKERRFTDA